MTAKAALSSKVTDELRATVSLPTGTACAFTNVTIAQPKGDILGRS